MAVQARYHLTGGDNLKDDILADENEKKSLLRLGIHVVRYMYYSTSPENINKGRLHLDLGSYGVVLGDFSSTD